MWPKRSSIVSAPLAGPSRAGGAVRPPPRRPGGQRISDDAVRRRTGRGWEEWFADLDAAGALDWDHRRIVAFLEREHSLSDWWCQMVAVAYEQARGLREPHQTAAGFQVSAGRTVAVPLARLYRFWADEALRRRWLPDVPLTVRRATPDRSLRIAWPDGGRVDVNFYTKGPARSEVRLQHSRLPHRQAVEEMRAFWREALERLRAALEEGERGS